MLPEIENYFKTMENEREKFQNARRHTTGQEEYLKARDAFDMATIDAWNALKNSDNKFVAWLANNEEITSEYRGHAEVVLKELPASVSELNQLAANNDWCSTWDGFRDDAIQAGALVNEYTITMKINGEVGWVPFREVTISRNVRVTREMITSLFDKGVNFVQLESGYGGVKYQYT